MNKGGGEDSLAIVLCVSALFSDVFFKILLHSLFYYRRNPCCGNQQHTPCDDRVVAVVICQSIPYPGNSFADK
jgi:hypothetical protein